MNRMGVLVLGVDPALCNTGWTVCRLRLNGRGRGVAVSVTVEACGVESPPVPNGKSLQAAKDAKRVGQLARLFGGLFRKHNFVAVATEGPGGSIRARSATASALAWGCLVGLAEDYAVPLSIVTPQELKKQTCGIANASKNEVAEAVSRLAAWNAEAGEQMEALAGGKREHAFDAVGAVWSLRRDRALLAALRAGG